MSRLSDDEVVEACQSMDIDPAWVLAIDVSAADVVLVLRVPLDGLAARYGGQARRQA